MWNQNFHVIVWFARCHTPDAGPRLWGLFNQTFFFLFSQKLVKIQSINQNIHQILVIVWVAVALLLAHGSQLCKLMKFQFDFWHMDLKESV